jgi:hypothetical protein
MTLVGLFTVLCFAAYRFTASTLKSKPDYFALAAQARAASPALPNRFSLLPGNADLAFDTVTGQRCRTWDWGIPHSTLNPPLCSDLATAARTLPASASHQTHD